MKTTPPRFFLWLLLLVGAGDACVSTSVASDIEIIGTFANGYVTFVTPSSVTLTELDIYRGSYPNTSSPYVIDFHYVSLTGFTPGCGQICGATVGDHFWFQLVHGSTNYVIEIHKSGPNDFLDWVIDTPLSITTIPFPPQKIFLAFGQPSSFDLFFYAAVFGRAWHIVIPGSIPAATVSDSYRTAVTSQIKEIFSRSGIHNLEWTTSDSDDAIAVYFCPTNPKLLGKSKSLDQFNLKRRGEVIVFVNETLPNWDAETAAHEIGHTLGLRHVNPPAATDPSDDEVMDDDFSDEPKFINAVSGVTDIPSFSTHNPLYHLRRYVEGWSRAQLQNAGIYPGTWDNGSTIDTRFSFQNETLRLYNITVFASGGNAESSFALEQISSATLAELSERTFAVPEGLGIVLLASSTTNGLPDVISSTGDAFIATNQVISPTGTNAFSLFRQDSPTNAVVISTATAEFDAQSPHCNIFVSAPGVLRLDFRGTLQTSTTLTNWTDVGAVSPHFIVIGSTNKAGFFRSRQ